MAPEDRIDALIGIIIELWSKSSDPRELHEVLGMTWEEYAAWANPLALARGEHPAPESRVGLDPDAGTRQHGETA